LTIEVFGTVPSELIDSNKKTSNFSVFMILF